MHRLTVTAIVTATATAAAVTVDVVNLIVQWQQHADGRNVDVMGHIVECILPVRGRDRDSGNVWIPKARLDYFSISLADVCEWEGE